MPVGSWTDPRLIPERLQADLKHILNGSWADPQSKPRQIPVRLQEDPKIWTQDGSQTDPEEIPHGSMELFLDRSQTAPKKPGWTQDRSQMDPRQILGFILENLSILRLFPVFSTAFPGRHQGQELHHLL